MKTIISILILLTGLAASLDLFAGWGEPSPLEERIRGADVVALITVTNVTKTVSTNAAGEQVTLYTAEAVVERTLKGTAPKVIRVTDNDWRSNSSRQSYFSADDVSRTINQPQPGKTNFWVLSNSWVLATTRFVVFVKGSGDSYSTFTSDCLAPAWTQDWKDGPVLFRWGCPRLGDAVASIQRYVKP